MIVLMSAGEKTKSLRQSVEKKLNSASGFSYIEVEYLDDIKDVFVRGERFERAFISEKAWTEDDTERDSYRVRQRIIDFVKATTERKNFRAEYVFVTSTSEMASLIYDELVPIQDQIVVLVEPKEKFKVGDAKICLTKELGELKKLKSAYDTLYDIQSEEAAPKRTTISEKEVEELEDYAQEIHYVEKMDSELYGDEAVTDGDGSYSEDDITHDYNIDDIFGEDYSGEIEVSSDNSYDDITFGSADIDMSDDMPEADDDWDFSQLNEHEQLGDELDEFKQAAELHSYGIGSVEDIGDDWLNELTEEGVTEEIPQEQFDVLDMVEDVELTVDYTQYHKQSQTDLTISRLRDEEQAREKREQEEAAEIAKKVSRQGRVDEALMDLVSTVENDTDTTRYHKSGRDMVVEPLMDDELFGGYGGQEQDEEVVEEVEEIVEAPQKSVEKPKKSLFGGKKEKKQPERNLQVPANPKNEAEMRNILDVFAKRGNSILVTGVHGSGVSVTAQNLAVTVSNLGYTCLLVDMDVVNKTQAYLNKDCFDSMLIDGANLMSAVNSTEGVKGHTAIARAGLHLLTMGMGSEVHSIDKMLKHERLRLFANSAKMHYNFVIYDMPFDVATDFAKDITVVADNVVMNIEASEGGITKAMLAIGNIKDIDVQSIFLERTQLLFNRARGMKKLFGKRLRKPQDILDMIDDKMLEIIGEDTGYYYRDLSVVGMLNEDVGIEDTWFTNMMYADKQGKGVYQKLLCDILLQENILR